jgi:hypothetical protein
VAITFDGTTNLLSWAGNIRSALPITIFAWIKRSNTSADRYPFSTVNTANVGFVTAIPKAYNLLAYGGYSHAAGYGDLATSSVDTSEFAWNPIMVSVTSTTINVWFGAAQTAGSTVGYSAADTLSSHDLFSIGGLGTTKSFIGDVCEVSVWNTALGDTEWATLKAGTAPEGVASGSLVEAWALRELGDYTGVNGRTLSVTGTLTRSGTDPFVRTAPGATATTLSGPSSGTVSVASTNFTVGANGTITGTVTVTPADGGAGGTFTPTTVAISSGTPTATFTYTPASTGVKTISISDNGGLTDAGSLSYTSNAAASGYSPRIFIPRPGMGTHFYGAR